MKINKLKINSYGKLKDKEINLESGINVIYGQNEGGKSTLINFIINSFYGISKNKNGKEVSDYDRYKPWSGEDFSGKIEYELDDKEKYEVYRDFNKKNPKIFNKNMEDISNNFNIDKNAGNEFFYEQTKIDEELFLSTLAINQGEVKLENGAQNFLIQKIANLAQTGDDNTSFKKVIERINRRQLDEVGTERSREKPINILDRNIKKLEQEKEELTKYNDFKCEFDEKENKLNNEILNFENENNFLKEIKLLNDNLKIEKEKIKIKENIKNDEEEKINLIKNKKIEIEKNNKNILEKNSENKNKKNNKKIIILNIIFIILILINILQYILIKNILIKNLIILTIPVFLIFYLYFLKNNKNNKKIIKNNYEKINLELLSLENEEKIIKNNLNNLNKEIEEIKNNLILKNNLEKEKIKNKYSEKIEKNKINKLINFEENIDLEIEKIQNCINDKKIEIHSLVFDKNSVETKLDKLASIEEELVNNNQKMSTIKRLNSSLNLAKDVLTEAYEKMKMSVVPKFSENLSNNIAKITNNKYNKVMFNEEKGLIVELENGDYIPVNRLSIGTIDQLYLSLRLSMIDELSQEVIPILLDESFAFYDDERLKNILLYLSNNFPNRQVIIFTCTGREKEILEKNSIKFNYISL